MESLKHLPSVANLYCLLGLAKHYQSKFPEALEYYSQCLSLNPNHDMVWTNIGAVFQSLGKVEESFEAYGRALDRLQANNMPLAKGEAGLLNNYGSLLMLIGVSIALCIHIQKLIIVILQRIQYFRENPRALHICNGRLNLIPIWKT